MNDYEKDAWAMAAVVALSLLLVVLLLIQLTRPLP